MNILDLSTFQELTSKLITLGYGKEIEWQRNLKPCEDWANFEVEAIWVILCSGMKEQIARVIAKRIWDAAFKEQNISEVFKHKGKVAAIKYVLSDSHRLFEEYKAAPDKIKYLQTIPFIGKITCYHLAKNLGHDCVKPDRHLERVAKEYNTTPDLLCEQIGKLTGEKKCVVDIIIWRACNLKLL